MIGYNEKINNIVIITNENKKIKRELGVCGLDILGKDYIYYDNNMELHILNTDYIKKIVCFKDKEKKLEINC